MAAAEAGNRRVKIDSVRGVNEQCRVSCVSTRACVRVCVRLCHQSAEISRSLSPAMFTVPSLTESHGFSHFPRAFASSSQHVPELSAAYCLPSAIWIPRLFLEFFSRYCFCRFCLRRHSDLISGRISAPPDPERTSAGLRGNSSSVALKKKKKKSTTAPRAVRGEGGLID